MPFINLPLEKRRAGEVPPEGDPASRLAIVGEAPGKVEVLEGRPFVGPAGRVLSECMHSAGITRHQVYITNTIKVKPDNLGRFFNKRTGRFTSEGEEWVARLRHELSVGGARAIVTCGKVATAALLGRADITAIRGYPFEVLLGGVKRVVVPTIHPAETLYSRNSIHRLYIAHDLQKAARLARDGWSPPQLEITIPQTVHEVRAAAELLQRATGPWAIDIEVINFEVSCIGFAYAKDRAVVVPIARAWGLDAEVEVWDILAELLETPGRVKIFHNAIFDVQFLAQHNGIFVAPPIFDTMIAHSLAYPDMLKSLGFIASVHTDLPYWKDWADFKSIEREE